MRSLTRWLVHLTNYINGGPPVSGRDARICVAFEDGGKEIPMFFSVGTPVCRRLRQNSVIFQSDRLLVR